MNDADKRRPVPQGRTIHPATASIQRNSQRYRDLHKRFTAINR